MVYREIKKRFEVLKLLNRSKMYVQVLSMVNRWL